MFFAQTVQETGCKLVLTARPSLLTLLLHDESEEFAVTRVNATPIARNVTAIDDPSYNGIRSLLHKRPSRLVILTPSPKRFTFEVRASATEDLSRLRMAFGQPL